MEREALAGSAGGSPARTDDDQGWRSRGYLPHFDRPGLMQMVTFRLADALPSDKLLDLRDNPMKPLDARGRQRVEDLMDSGHGACHLRDPRIAQSVEDNLLHFDGIRYHLLAWVVMPNHVHVMIEVLSGSSLSQIVQSWKSYTSKEANCLLGRSGRFWQPEYFDRAIRDVRHFNAAMTYIHENPVKAGLVQRPEDWPYSSAGRYCGESLAGEPPALPAVGHFGPHSRHTIEE